LKAILFLCNYWQPSANTTNIEIGYPTQADAAAPPRPDTREAAVIRE